MTLRPHLKRLVRDRFLGGMIAAVVLASLFPNLGRSGGSLHAEVLADVGIFIVFFLHGIGLATRSLKAAALHWRLHLLVQGLTFCVFPLLWLLLDGLLGRWVPQDLRLGFYYLCVLPSTISSSVALTALAGGNVSAALFNATLSSLLGIVLTPLLVSLMVSTIGTGPDLGETILNTATLLLLPIVIGQLLRPVLGDGFARRRRITHALDRGVILLLVFVSFCDSVAAGLWREHGTGILALTLAGALLILAIVLLLSIASARGLGLVREDEITAVFCGSKKTLASGVPMAKLLFGAHPGLGLIVLPILLYHQAQLLVGTILAQHYARRKPVGTAPAVFADAA